MKSNPIRSLRAAVARIVPAAVLLLSACSGGPEEYKSAWVYQPNQSFVHDSSGQVRTPAELLAEGRALAKAGRTDDAVDAFRAIHYSGVDPALKSEALLEEARTLAAARRRAEAHSAYRQFLSRFPTSPQVPAVIREAFDNAFALADDDTDVGIQAVRDLLRDFPREDFSGAYAFRLAELFFKREEYLAAIPEFEEVRREYARTPWAEAALFRIGLCHLQQFKGTSYDPRPLREARQRFEKFLQDFPTSSLADEAGGQKGAKQWLAEVKSLQAKKDEQVADYYNARGREIAARTMYAAVIKDYPDTPAAREAQRMLEAFAPADDPSRGQPH